MPLLPLKAQIGIENHLKSLGVHILKGEKVTESSGIIQKS
jgi:hypothetical protein